MKRFFTILVLLFLSSSAFAINWLPLKSLRGTEFYLDTDSIVEYNNNYFFNIKIFSKQKNDFVIMTLQTRIKSALLSRIKYYTCDEYESLNGNYEHITDKMTKTAEIVTYGSVAHKAYTTVSSIVQANKFEVKF